MRLPQRDTMTPQLQCLIVNRLVATGADREDWSFIVLAALEGDAALRTYLDGQPTMGAPAASAAFDEGTPPSREPPGVYVSSVTVEGFRGVGPAATLTLHPGPGLTLVVGRNGSGKSSFAEGLEVLLTGSNYRWAGRTKAWVEGWRNLHHDTTAVRADLVVEGQGPVTVSRTWTGDRVTDSVATARVPGEPGRPLEALGWTDALATFRPFLSYNELGSLLEEGPSKLYDALSSVLGLDELTAVQGRLGEARKARQAVVKVATDRASVLIDEVEAVAAATNDSRAHAALRALRARSWDLDALAALASGDDADRTPELALLRRLQALSPPDVDAVVALAVRLRDADSACVAFAGTDAERCRERARLLDEAIGFHERHAGSTCPVCGTDGVLTSAWRDAARDEVTRLKTEAAACERAEGVRQQAVAEARHLLLPPPAVLAEAPGLGLAALPAVRDAWARWAAGREEPSATRLADHLENNVLDFVAAVNALVAEAADQLRRRQDAWRPVRLSIAAWLPEARRALAAAEQLPPLKKAEEWWKQTGREVRDERFKPIAERAIAVWAQLRLQSNVDLGDVELEGAAQRRRVTLRVTVDGTEAEALGVMSQGELHSLALSLFLPRATLPESPFRFVSVDDPVQSMDPARVEGLARALADTARTRQVVVFTHDDRLPEAVRRLGIPATVVGVTRRANSCVELRTVSDAMQMYLDDARALALTEKLPSDVAARVVPGFCRGALEAACMALVRRRLKAGVVPQDVEDVLAANARLYPLMALALFDDERQTAEVLRRLGQRFGPAAAEAFKACNTGAHEGYEGDLRGLVDGVACLARGLASA